MTETDIVKNLTGMPAGKVAINDSGFLSRAYIVENGKFVFKFPRNNDARYDNEIKSINFLNTLDLGVNLQKVAHVGKKNSYLGLHGVTGKPLNSFYPTNRQDIAMQLFNFIDTLHKQTPKDFPTFTLDDGISWWHTAYHESKDFFAKHLSSDECKLLDKFMMDYVPRKLHSLGYKPVFSHGDLNSGNILIDPNGKVGIIDCSECGYYDESIDFANIPEPQNKDISDMMLDMADADEILREKVELRHDVKPIRIIKFFINRGEDDCVQQMLDDTRRVIKKYQSVLLTF